MTDQPNYGEIADRIEAGNARPFLDAPHIMALLGYETKTDHGRLGVACRPVGETHWQSMPNIYSADDFELWVLNKREGSLDDIRLEGDGRYAISYSDNATGGNEYGFSMKLGRAMWAAFVRTVGGTNG